MHHCPECHEACYCDEPDHCAHCDESDPLGDGFDDSIFGGMPPKNDADFDPFRDDGDGDEIGMRIVARINEPLP